MKLTDLQALRRMWERVLGLGVGIQLWRHAGSTRGLTLPGTFQVSKLMAWLMAQDGQTSTSHSQAVDIGQALLTAGLMDSFLWAGQGVLMYSVTAQTCTSPACQIRRLPTPVKSLTEKKNRSGDMKYRETVADILGFGDLKRSVADLEDSEDSDSELLEFFSSSNLTRLNNILTSCLQLKIFKKN